MTDPRRGSAGAGPLIVLGVALLGVVFSVAIGRASPQDADEAKSVAAVEATPISSPTAVPTPDPNLFLPDLQTTVPDELYIREAQDGEGREVRFSTTVNNLG